MPFALIIIGLFALIAGVRGTQGELLTLLKGDFTGQNNFIYWMLAILLIGSVGYVKPLQPLSRAFLVLVLIVLFLSHGGFFERFTQQISSSTTTGAF